MANYDNKLGEWFKRLDKTEKDLKAKKTGGDQPVAPRPTQPAARGTWQPPVESAAIQEPVVAASPTIVAQAVETRTTETQPEPMANSTVETVEMTSEPREVRQVQSLFDDTDGSPVEDFLSFLNRTEEARPADTMPVVETSRNRGVGHLSEGTGEPRPIAPLDIPILGVEVDETEEVAEAEMFETFEPSVAEVPVPVKEPELDLVIEPERKPRQARGNEKQRNLQEKWDRMPHHLQTLFGVTTGEEVAQNSYKTFKEGRGELIQRLLDPPITLEEAARVLDVCPTTVRRYTNKGILRHFRTAGNQRRFRLSDVLTFMETHGRSAKPASEMDED